jgi:hypothetical protein
VKYPFGAGASCAENQQKEYTIKIVISQ